MMAPDPNPEMQPMGFAACAMVAVLLLCVAAYALIYRLTTGEWPDIGE